MHEATGGQGVVAETTGFLQDLEGMPDHRQHGEVVYPRDEGA